jgi:hypothetical protein
MFLVSRDQGKKYGRVQRTQDVQIECMVMQALRMYAHVMKLIVGLETTDNMWHAAQILMW